jgi:hypothetical protein
LSTDDFGSLCDSLDNVKHIEVTSREYNIAFDGIMLTGAQGGSIKVLPDPFLPKTTAVMGDFVNPDNAYLIYSGDLVQIDDHDGNMFLRAASATAYEARMYFYGNLVVAAPGRFIKTYNLGL